jgi:hypothetical protein
MEGSPLFLERTNGKLLLSCQTSSFAPRSLAVLSLLLDTIAAPCISYIVDDPRWECYLQLDLADEVGDDAFLGNAEDLEVEVL